MDEWITGGNFGPEASIFSMVVSIITLIILITWKSDLEKTKNLETPMAVDLITER